MSYEPGPTPFDVKDIPRFLNQELSRIAKAFAGNTESVFYRTMPVTSDSLSVSSGISANWKIFGNVLLFSASVTQTVTGFQRGVLDAYREVVFVNVGSGVAVLKREAAESSASNRFALVTDVSLSQNGAVTFWRDPYASRWRGISRL